MDKSPYHLLARGAKKDIETYLFSLLFSLKPEFRDGVLMVSSLKLDARLILDSIRFVIRAYRLLKVKPPKIRRWYVIMAYRLF